MADRTDADREVLTSLPRTRPVHRSAKRSARPAGAAAAKPKAKAAAAAKPRKAAAKPRAAAQPKATARAPRPDRGPAPRRKIPPAGYASPTSHDQGPERAAAPELLGTAVQAAGELAQIGLAVGRQTLRSMIDRLPRP